ncbi:hypothetical protein [Mycobacterium phage MKC-IRE-02]
MSDPATEAAKRVCPGTDSPTAMAIYRTAEAGAREALKPIREWFDRSYGMSSITDNLLDELEPLIYASEELS